MQQLKTGSLLQGGKYKIEKVLGQGGFGITYLATQELFDRKVCIKEFFFKEYCERNEATSHVSLGTQSNHELVERFMNKFLKEARTISQLEHPHIIRIHDIFKENNTAYYVMEYIEGESLADRVNHYGALPESEAVGYIKQVASALDFIHQRSINHLDVKPANIMIRQSDNKAILIDFGLSKQYDAQGGQTSTTPVGISHGYAPMEQYNAGGVSTFSPQTDIYSLGATLYKLVTGNTPPQAGEVLNDGLPELPVHLSDEVRNAIGQAMQVRKKDRPGNIESLLYILQNENCFDIKNSMNKGANMIQDNEDTFIIQNKEPLKKTEQKESRIENNGNKGKGKKLIWIFLFIVITVGSIFCFVDKRPKDVKLFDEGWEYYNDSIFDKAFARFEESANLGNVSAQFYLGLCFCYGNGTNTNMKKAFEYWNKAAEEGYVPAQTNVGICYYYGDGVKKNYSKAVEWLNLAIEQKDANAQFHLGLCYYNGNGVKRNMKKAKEFITLSAEQGNEWAQNFLKENKFTISKSTNKTRAEVNDTVSSKKQELERQKKQEAEDLKKRFNQDENGICQNQIVDLGLSVKWAGWNVGANSVYQYGGYYGWGDASGSRQSTYNNHYPNANPPLDICGNIQYDIVKKQWGNNWRLPTYQEFDELLKKCIAEDFEYKGVKGFKITGPNGNSMFLPFAGSWDYKSVNGQWVFTNPIKINNINKSGAYYCGNAKRHAGAYAIYPYSLYIDNTYLNDKNTWGGIRDVGFRFIHHSVRGVYIGYN